MIKCPKCGGYGKVISTRNLDNCVVRYHKCDDCNYSFISTQKANELSYLTSKNIDNALKSDSFNFCISLLKNAFLLSKLDFYNESIESKNSINEYVIRSNPFSYNKKNNINICMFEINLKVYNDKAIGSIHLINKTDNRIIALVGYIYRDCDWKIDLNSSIINDIL